MYTMSIDIYKILLSPCLRRNNDLYRPPLDCSSVYCTFAIAYETIVAGGICVAGFAGFGAQLQRFRSADSGDFGTPKDSQAFPGTNTQ